MAAITPELKRVITWTQPRSLSTVFTKCMSFVDGVQIFHDPFMTAHNFGPDSPVSSADSMTTFIESAASNLEENFPNLFDDNVCTYEWAKQQLSEDYPGKEVLVVKDQAFCVEGRFDMIPSGFRHAFLIRHPNRMIPSWKKLAAKVFKMDCDTTPYSELLLDPGYPRMIYKIQYDLLQYVKNNLDPNPVVIDSDDLQSNPASLLPKFCHALGIPYKDSLLQWPSSDDIMKTWKAGRLSVQGNLLEDEGGYWYPALRSTCFKPLSPLPSLSAISEDMHEVINDNLPYYKKMHSVRITP